MPEYSVGTAAAPAWDYGASEWLTYADERESLGQQPAVGTTCPCGQSDVVVVDNWHICQHCGSAVSLEQVLGVLGLLELQELVWGVVSDLTD